MPRDLANCGLIANAIPIDQMDEYYNSNPYHGLSGALAGASNFIDQ